MDVLPMLPDFPFAPLFQVGLLGELWMSYFTAFGNVVVQPLAPAGEWHIFPVGLEAINGTMGVVYGIMGGVPVVVSLMVDCIILYDGGLISQSSSGTGAFLPSPHHDVSMTYLPPNKDVRHTTTGKKLEPNVHARKEIQTVINACPRQVVMRQEHLTTAKRNPPTCMAAAPPVFRPKGVIKEEATTIEVDDFPQLPEEWPY